MKFFVCAASDHYWDLNSRHDADPTTIAIASRSRYRQSSIERHQLNHQVRKEPRNAAEAFGEVGEPVAH